MLRLFMRSWGNETTNGMGNENRCLLWQNLPLQSMDVGFLVVTKQKLDYYGTIKGENIHENYSQAFPGQQSGTALG